MDIKQNFSSTNFSSIEQVTGQYLGKQGNKGTVRINDSVSFHHLPCNLSVKRNNVGFIYVLIRGYGFMCKITIIGNYQKSRCILVQSANGEKPVSAPLFRHQIDHRFSVFIGRSGKHTARLIHKNIDIFFIFHSLSVKKNFAPGINR